MFTFKEIYQAYLHCRKGKRNSLSALDFETNLIENICNLETSLNSRVYTPQRSICFFTKSQKLREIFAAAFSDRVIQHLLTPILEELFEPTFIYDSYSSRQNKGIHSAQKRALHFSKASRYYLQLDIKNFFYSIDKEILFEKIKEKLLAKYEKLTSTQLSLYEILWLTHVIIFHDVTNNVKRKGSNKHFHTLPKHKSLFTLDKKKGLPVGNLSSQFFANVYMNDFDNYIKRGLKVKRYLRYVDDFVIFDNSQKRLRAVLEKIKDYLQMFLGLELRDKMILKSVHSGLDFLGYIIRPNYVLVRKRVVNNFKYKKAYYLESYEKQKGTMKLEEIKRFLSVQASFVGHISHANSYNLYHKVGVIHESNPFDYDRL